MRKLIIITLPLLVLIFSSQVMAQENVQNNRANSEQNNNSEDLKNEDLKRLTEEYMGMVENCANGEDSEFCRTATSATLDVLKNFVIDRFEKAETQTTSMIQRVRNTNNLTSADNEMLDTTLDGYSTLMDEYKQKIRDAQSIPELQRIAREANTNNELKARLAQLHTRRLHAGMLNIDHFIGRMNRYIERLEKHIEAAVLAGNDTSEVERHIELAREKLLQAKIIYDQNVPAMRNNENFNRDTAKAELLRAKDMLIEAKNDLRNAVEALKILYKSNPWEVS